MACVATAAFAFAPASVSARGGFHGGGWHGFGPAVAGGLIAGAVVGGIASSAYAWAPGDAYYGGYYPAYRGYDVAPAYGYYNGYHRFCPDRGYGAYYNCGAYAVPGYGP